MKTVQKGTAGRQKERQEAQNSKKDPKICFYFATEIAHNITNYEQTDQTHICLPVRIHIKHGNIHFPRIIPDFRINQKQRNNEIANGLLELS